MTKSTWFVHRGVLVFSLLAAACAHKPVTEGSSNDDLQGEVSELQTTVRSQNRIIQDLKTQLLVLEKPVKSISGTTRKGLSGVSLASGPDENQILVAPPSLKAEQEPTTQEAPVAAPIVLIPQASPKFADERDPVKIYEASRALLEQRETDLAFQGFSKLVKEFRAHPLTDNAYFEIGKIYIQRGESERAIFHFRQMAVLFPNGDRLADGQLALAGLLETLGEKSEAQKIFSSIASQFAGSSAAVKAKQKISKLDAKG